MVAVCGERGEELGKCMGVRNGVIMNNNNNKKRDIRNMHLLSSSMFLKKRAHHGNI